MVTLSRRCSDVLARGAAPFGAASVRGRRRPAVCCAAATLERQAAPVGKILGTAHRVVQGMAVP